MQNLLPLIIAATILALLSFWQYPKMRMTHRLFKVMLGAKLPKGVKRRDVLVRYLGPDGYAEFSEFRPFLAKILKTLPQDTIWVAYVWLKDREDNPISVWMKLGSKGGNVPYKIQRVDISGPTGYIDNVTMTAGQEVFTFSGHERFNIFKLILEKVNSNEKHG